ncbi:hypothetical protein I3843_04G069200 [Carya illinoinensis]|nr:hypothetical protein I3843_04G069200 [Carya illinoinensis]
MGCKNTASIRSLLDDTLSFSGCESPCDRAPDAFTNGSQRCKDTNCCQTTIPRGLSAFITTIEPKSSDNSNNECNYAFLVDLDWFYETNFSEPKPNMSVPIVLLWSLDNTSFYSLPATKKPTAMEYKNSSYSCYLLTRTTGNPYLLGGCKDIDECADLSYPCIQADTRCENTEGGYLCVTAKNNKLFIIIGVSTSLGVLFLIFGGWGSYKVINKRINIKRKEKFFKRNGGLLLQQQLSSSDHVNVESNKLFSSKDLEEATDRFNVNRILGQGGQGTVYKGMLSDGRIVAVKRSMIIDEEKLEEFVNEVVVLSQINHRNVVKLLGCCLETEVPLLVYEFVPNGTLARYLDDQNEEFPLTWGMHLRIATEVAGALFYLHSAASSPIYHRDIKTTNILLDEKHRAKVADFGTSRSIAIDQTHLTTLVYGTFGYLDPEYFQSSQFTDKSDVYSFGVVLAELLTGEKAISSKRTLETKSLATYFLNSMEENNLFDIIDNRVLKEAKKEEIITVANLVKRCLNLSGKKRPTMKEVAKELEAVLQMSQNFEEVLVLKNEMFDQYNVVSTSTIASMDNGRASSLDAEPLL